MFRTLSVILGIGVFLHCESLLAFTLNMAQVTVNGQTRNLVFAGWQSSAVTFDLDSSCIPYSSIVQEAVNGAIKLWNSVPSAHLTVQIGTTVSLPRPITAYVGDSATDLAPAGNPIIICDPNFEANSGASASDIPGFAGAFNVDANSGRVLGALLVLNFQANAAASIETLGGSVVKQILAHEIGHVLGLGHSADVNALMYYSTSVSKVAALALDDVSGITYLYPRNEPSGGGAFGCATVIPLAGSRGSWNKAKESPESGANSIAMTECMLLMMICVLGKYCFRWRNPI